MGREREERERERDGAYIPVERNSIREAEKKRHGNGRAVIKVQDGLRQFTYSRTDEIETSVVASENVCRN